MIKVTANVLRQQITNREGNFRQLIQYIHFIYFIII